MGVQGKKVKKYGNDLEVHRQYLPNRSSSQAARLARAGILNPMAFDYDAGMGRAALPPQEGGAAAQPGGDALRVHHRGMAGRRHPPWRHRRGEGRLEGTSSECEVAGGRPAAGHFWLCSAHPSRARLPVPQIHASLWFMIRLICSTRRSRAGSPAASRRWSGRTRASSSSSRPFLADGGAAGDPSIDLARN